MTKSRKQIGAGRVAKLLFWMLVIEAAGLACLLYVLVGQTTVLADNELKWVTPAMVDDPHIGSDLIHGNFGRLVSVESLGQQDFVNTRGAVYGADTVPVSFTLGTSGMITWTVPSGSITPSFPAIVLLEGDCENGPVIAAFPGVYLTFVQLYNFGDGTLQSICPNWDHDHSLLTRSTLLSVGGPVAEFVPTAAIIGLPSLYENGYPCARCGCVFIGTTQASCVFEDFCSNVDGTVNTTLEPESVFTWTAPSASVRGRSPASVLPVGDSETGLGGGHPLADQLYDLANGTLPSISANLYHEQCVPMRPSLLFGSGLVSWSVAPTAITNISGLYSDGQPRRGFNLYSEASGWCPSDNNQNPDRYGRVFIGTAQEGCVFEDFRSGFNFPSGVDEEKTVNGGWGTIRGGPHLPKGTPGSGQQFSPSVLLQANAILGFTEEPTHPLLKKSPASSSSSSCTLAAKTGDCNCRARLRFQSVSLAGNGSNHCHNLIHEDSGMVLLNALSRQPLQSRLGSEFSEEVCRLFNSIGFCISDAFPALVPVHSEYHMGMMAIHHFAAPCSSNLKGRQV